MALNAKQKAFVNEYLISKNATKAAKAARYSCSNDKSFGVTGSRLLANPEVKAAIEKGLAFQEKNALKRAEEYGLNKDRWLKELCRIAFANMDDYITINEKQIQYGEDDEPQRVLEAVPVPTIERARYLGHAIKKIGETKNGISLELHSKTAALETIGRHFGWVKDKNELVVPGGVKVNLTMPSNGREVQNQNVKKPTVKKKAKKKTTRKKGS